MNPSRTQLRSVITSIKVTRRSPNQFTSMRLNSNNWRPDVNLRHTWTKLFGKERCCHSGENHRTKEVSLVRGAETSVSTLWEAKIIIQLNVDLKMLPATIVVKEVT